MATHRVGVTLGLLVLLGREGRLGDEGPQPGVVGRLGEVGQLVVGHRQLFAQLAKTGGNLRQAALDEGSGHPTQSTLPRVRPPQAFRPARHVPHLLLHALVAAGLAACGGGSGDEGSPCGPIRRESLDSAYLVHVLDDDAPIEYTSSPPTSGPHKPTPPIGGVVDEPIPEPIQVGVLERGDVLLQYLPSIDAAERAALEALAGERVTVAPNPDLNEPVVATAWVFKQSCGAVDVGELQQFMDERIGKGPDG